LQRIAKDARRCCREGESEGRRGRKKVKEEEAGRRKWKLKHRQFKLLILGLDQITKFVYRLDGPLGDGNV
jgi:hypothetical protein